MSGKIKKLNNGNSNFTIEKLKNRVTVKNFSNKPQFIQFYIENLDWVTTNLTQMEMKIFGRCVIEMGINNILRLSSDFRRGLETKLKVTASTVSKGISALIEKGVLIELNTNKMSDKELDVFDIDRGDRKLFLINPEIVGRGSIRDMTKMRQTVIQDFSFDELQYKKTVIGEMEYAGLDDVVKNSNLHRIKNINVEENESGGRDIEIVLEENTQLSEENIQPNLFPDNAPKLLSNLSDSIELKSDYDKEIAEYIELKAGYEKELQKKVEELRKKFAEKVKKE